MLPVAAGAQWKVATELGCMLSFSNLGDKRNSKELTAVPRIWRFLTSCVCSALLVSRATAPVYVVVSAHGGRKMKEMTRGSSEEEEMSTCAGTTYKSGPSKQEGSDNVDRRRQGGAHLRSCKPKRSIVCATATEVAVSALLISANDFWVDLWLISAALDPSVRPSGTRERERI